MTLGLADAIRAAYKTTGDYPMAAQDVKLQLERMGYGGRWGNVLCVNTHRKRDFSRKVKLRPQEI